MKALLHHKYDEIPQDYKETKCFHYLLSIYLYFQSQIINILLNFSGVSSVQSFKRKNFIQRS